MAHNPYLAQRYGAVLETLGESSDDNDDYDASLNFSRFVQSNHMTQRVFRPSKKEAPAPAEVKAVDPTLDLLSGLRAGVRRPTVVTPEAKLPPSTAGIGRESGVHTHTPSSGSTSRASLTRGTSSPQLGLGVFPAFPPNVLHSPLPPLSPASVSSAALRPSPASLGGASLFHPPPGDPESPNGVVVRVAASPPVVASGGSETAVEISRLHHIVADAKAVLDRADQLLHESAPPVFRSDDAKSDGVVSAPPVVGPVESCTPRGNRESSRVNLSASLPLAAPSPLPQHNDAVGVNRSTASPLGDDAHSAVVERDRTSRHGEKDRHNSESASLSVASSDSNSGVGEGLPLRPVRNALGRGDAAYAGDGTEEVDDDDAAMAISPLSMSPPPWVADSRHNYLMSADGYLGNPLTATGNHWRVHSPATGRSEPAGGPSIRGPAPLPVHQGNPVRHAAARELKCVAVTPISNPHQCYAKRLSRRPTSQHWSMVPGAPAATAIAEQIVDPAGEPQPPRREGHRREPSAHHRYQDPEKQQRAYESARRRASKPFSTSSKVKMNEMNDLLTNLLQLMQVRGGGAADAIQPHSRPQVILPPPQVVVGAPPALSRLELATPAPVAMQSCAAAEHGSRGRHYRGKGPDRFGPQGLEENVTQPAVDLSMSHSLPAYGLEQFEASRLLQRASAGKKTEGSGDGGTRGDGASVQRYMMPTESWRCKAPEFDDIHLSHPRAPRYAAERAPSQGRGGVFMKGKVTATRDEEVARFNKRAKRFEFWHT